MRRAIPMGTDNWTALSCNKRALCPYLTNRNLGKRRFAGKDAGNPLSS